MRRRTILAGGTLLWAADGPRDLRIFLLTGQSNMAGRGTIEDSDQRSIERVWSMNKANEWALAADPLHYDKPAIAGVGLGRTFARVLAAADPEVVARPLGESVSNGGNLRRCGHRVPQV